MNWMCSGKRIRIAIAASVVVIVLAAIAWWHASDAWNATLIETFRVVPGIQFRQLKLANRNAAFDATCITFNRSEAQVEVVDLGIDSTKRLGDVLVEHDALVVVNGGYFDAERKPIGLLRIKGKTVSEVTDQAPLSGCVLIDQDGLLMLASRTDPAVTTSDSAIQSGPFLIDPGGAIGIHGDTSPAAERTVIAMDGNLVCILSTTPVRLLDLSRCLHAKPESFGLQAITSALNLDGGPSTGIAIQSASHKLSHEPRGKIRDALTVRSR